MNKKELVNAIAEKAELSKKDSETVLNTVVETITEELGKGNDVKIFQFGNFTTVTRAARDGINPSTGEKIRIEETVSPKFKPSKTLKNIVKGS